MTATRFATLAAAANSGRPGSALGNAYAALREANDLCDRLAMGLDGARAADKAPGGPHGWVARFNAEIRLARAASRAAWQRVEDELQKERERERQMEAFIQARKRFTRAEGRVTDALRLMLDCAGGVEWATDRMARCAEVLEVEAGRILEERRARRPWSECEGCGEPMGRGAPKAKASRDMCAGCLHARLAEREISAPPVSENAAVSKRQGKGRKHRRVCCTASTPTPTDEGSPCAT